jgi:hypothetical protein
VTLEPGLKEQADAEGKRQALHGERTFRSHIGQGATRLQAWELCNVPGKPAKPLLSDPLTEDLEL